MIRHVLPAPPTVSELPLVVRAPCRARCPVVGIGASAGGPPALSAILAALPAQLPACIAIVQHIANGFAESFVQFLQRHTSLRVMLVDRTVPVQPGVVLVPLDDHHLVANQASFEPTQDSSDQSFSAIHRPVVFEHRPGPSLQRYRRLAHRHRG